MRGRDEETGEFLGASRSQQRREALDVLALGTRLVGLTATQLEKLPIPDALRGHIRDTQRITSHIARKRQLAFLAKQMRREDDEALDAIRDALEAGGEASRREVALMHRIEHWRTKLLDEGDAAMTEFVALHPAADAQQLRTLVRNTAEEKKRNKPPRAFRELYQVVREAMTGGAGDAADADADDSDAARDED